MLCELVTQGPTLVGAAMPGALLLAPGPAGGVLCVPRLTPAAMPANLGALCATPAATDTVASYTARRS